MALIISGTKGAISVTDAYLVIMDVHIQKTVSQTDAPVTGVTCLAHGHIYASLEDRQAKLGNPTLQVSFAFEHGAGYPVEEAYLHIHANGLPDWNLTRKDDV